MTHYTESSGYAVVFPRMLPNAPSSPSALYQWSILTTNSEEEAHVAVATIAPKKRGGATLFSGSGGYAVSRQRILREARQAADLIEGCEQSVPRRLFSI